MKKTVLAAFAAGAALTAGSAFDDQCAWIPLNQAKAGVAIARNFVRVLDFCEPCGQKKPSASKVRVLRQATLKPTSTKGLFEVYINGKAVDLAYTFFSKDGRTFQNAARLARCPAQGVSPSVTLQAPGAATQQAQPAAQRRK